jgi:3-methyladenine DNA glycosylase AlkD
VSRAGEIRAALEARADPAYLKSIQRLVPGVRTLGVRIPQIKALAAELHQRWQLSDGELWSLMDALCAGRIRDEMLLGVVLISRRRKALAPWSHIERWVKEIDNWETCDQLATNVIAGRVAGEPALLKKVEQWSGASNFWLRRLAVATTVGLNQRGRSNVAAALSVCAGLMNDAEPMVRKAVGWALREASEQDPAAAFALLKSHRTKAHKSVLREGAQKLPAELRKQLGQ